MSIGQAVFLGAVQGLGEFLPISSSAHLILIPYVFRFKPHTLSFDVALHLGTLFALAIYFFKDWVKLFREGLAGLKSPLSASSLECRLFWYIVFASIPAALTGVLLEDKAETVFRNPLLAALILAVFGIVFYFAQKIGANSKPLAEISLKEALFIGMAQALAIIPGVSRSAATIACGLSLNFKKEDAVRFSFLLSFPVILGAGIFKIKDIFFLLQDRAAIASLSAGFLVSVLFGLFSIHFLLKFVKKHNFNIFIIYRLLVFVLVAAIFILTRIVR